MLTYSSPPGWIGLARVTNRILQKWRGVASELGHKNPCGFQGHSFWRMSAAMSWEYTSSPIKKSMWQGSETSANRHCEPPRHVSAPSLKWTLQLHAAFGWLQILWHLDYNFTRDAKPQSLSQPIPKCLSHQNHEVINIYSSLRFEVICYVAIDNRLISLYSNIVVWVLGNLEKKS